MAPKAASQALKRKQEAAKLVIPGKKPCKDLGNPPLKAVLEGLELLAEKNIIPESCQQMLVAMLPGSLLVPADKRDASQKRIVDMVREVLQGVEVSMQEAVTAEGQQVNDVEASRQGAVAAVAEAQAAATAAQEFSAGKKSVADETQALLETKSKALKATQEAEKTGNSSLEAAEAQRTQLQDAIIDGSLRILCSDSGEWDAAASAEHCQALMTVIKEIGTTDESLLLSVPACLKKAPADRGDFDKMVLDQVEKSLKEKVSQLTATLADGQAAKAERAALVEGAQRDFDSAQAVKMDAEEAHSNAEAAQQEAVASLRERTSVLQKSEPELKRAQAARDGKQVALEVFQSTNMKSFAELEAKMSAEQVARMQAGA